MQAVYLWPQIRFCLLGRTPSPVCITGDAAAPMLLNQINFAPTWHEVVVHGKAFMNRSKMSDYVSAVVSYFAVKEAVIPLNQKHMVLQCIFQIRRLIELYIAVITSATVQNE